ncbi:MAG: zinc-dependent peptidase [Chitinophagales bacterium]
MITFIFILIAVLVLLASIVWLRNQKTNSSIVHKAIPTTFKIKLAEKINFYHALSPEDKMLFEKEMQTFIANTKITPIKTTIDELDKYLIAASAIIPIFAFRDWHYPNLEEVLIYPNRFNREFATEGPDRSILGMVGTGYMNGKMILSKKALHDGFSNDSDKKNTAIHEFVHLIDKLDGTIDGIPKVLIDNQYILPWLDLMNQKIADIHEGKSDINPYGGTSQIEFFAVASEYFFERPLLLEKNHPKLYKSLEKIFKQDMTEVDLDKEKEEIGRNSPCPCGSGEKYKRCCGKNL